MTVTSLPWPVGSSGYLRYTYNGSETLSLLDVYGTITYDSFKFKVMDEHGANSSSATFDITVRIPLLAQPSSLNYGEESLFLLLCVFCPAFYR